MASGSSDWTGTRQETTLHFKVYLSNSTSGFVSYAVYRCGTPRSHPKYVLCVEKFEIVTAHAFERRYKRRVGIPLHHYQSSTFGHKTSIHTHGVSRYPSWCADVQRVLLQEQEVDLRLGYIFQALFNRQAWWAILLIDFPGTIDPGAYSILPCARAGFTIPTTARLF